VRSLGATPQHQTVVDLSATHLLPVLADALLGIPAAMEVYAARSGVWPRHPVGLVAARHGAGHSAHGGRAPPGVPQVEVSFGIGADSSANVSANDLGTGVQQSVQIPGG
jgi:hypothetical protein